MNENNFEIDYNTTLGEILNITDPEDFKEVLQVIYERWNIFNAEDLGYHSGRLGTLVCWVAIGMLLTLFGRLYLYANNQIRIIGVSEILTVNLNCYSRLSSILERNLQNGQQERIFFSTQQNFEGNF